jgi:hypothetical protein
MNSDSDYQIGKDHVVCEDYALSGVGEGGESAFAIVCDGCSASNDVDFGARALALSAREVLIKNKNDDYFTGGISYDSFGLSSIETAAQIFNVFPTLNRQTLDATLLIAWVKNNKLTAYMYGDGVLFRKTKDIVHTLHLELEPGAPDYLSYRLDTGRRQSYDSENVVKHRNDEFRDKDGAKGYPTEMKPFEPVVIECDVNPGDIIVVGSDGINSFRKSDGTSIPWNELVDEYIGYKNFAGEFVKRRMGAFKRKCLKEGITHFDDVSVATIVV